jgi:phosphoribosylformylglycinamidine synthase II
MTIFDDTRFEHDRTAPGTTRPAGNPAGGGRAPLFAADGPTTAGGSAPGVAADTPGAAQAPGANGTPATDEPRDGTEPAGAQAPAAAPAAAAEGQVPDEPDGYPAQSGRLVWPQPPPAEIDSVDEAVATPDLEQPYLELGLRPDEYDRIRRILGRRPTRSELGMYSIMWSEHCSYKSSKVHLRQFSEKAPASPALLAGIGENAGVVRVAENLAVTFKIESHNHPSFVEPHQGAATGVGGIVRDILAMGARPIGVMDSLRFGAAEHPDTARVLPGVVDGVGAYGNCLGLPNVGGEVVFDPCYQGNPLVNALCVGVLPADRLQNKAAVGPGNVVVLLGAKTGRDGIGGVSVLASATFGEASHTQRPSVQVGDPFTEKLLIESCLEMYELGLVAGIQDLGGAGLTCALSETAAAAGTGMRVWLDHVPLREPSMAPEEVLASESQERMLAIVEPDRMTTLLAVAEKWGVQATPIGRVTEPGPGGGRLVVSWHDEIVVDVPPASLADEGPVYARPMREPGDLVLLQADRAETLPRPAEGEGLRRALLDMIASPNLCDRSWITDQYDRYVLGNTVLAQPENSGVLRVDEQSGLGIALSVDGNGRYTRLDPYRGAQLALAEAYRNVAVTGAQPVAVTNCLNFGSPEDPAVMWQFAEAVRGLADGCAELGIPVTGGNVSFYNQTGAAPINPTPVVGVLGVLPQVRDRVPMGFQRDGDILILLGETRDELSGSEWAWVTHQHLGGLPPRVDLAAERTLGALVADAASRGQLTAAHDLSEGGLAQALVEGCLRYDHGAKILLPSEVSAFTALFSESTARAVVSVPHGQERGFTALCDEYGVPWTAIGVVTAGEPLLEIRDQFTVSLAELRAAHELTLPDLFGLVAAETSAVSAPPAGVEEPRAGDGEPVSAPPAGPPAAATAPPPATAPERTTAPEPVAGGTAGDVASAAAGTAGDEATPAGSVESPPGHADEVPSFADWAAGRAEMPPPPEGGTEPQTAEDTAPAPAAGRADSDPEATASAGEQVDAADKDADPSARAGGDAAEAAPEDAALGDAAQQAEDPAAAVAETGDPEPTGEDGAGGEADTRRDG